MEKMPPSVALAIVLALILGLALLNPPVQPSNYGIELGSDNSSQNAFPWETLATIFAALFTGGLVWYAQAQLHENRQTAARQLRAYVSVTKAEISDVGIDLAPKGFLAIHNNGQTPAYDFYATIGITIGPHPLPEGAELPSPLIILADGKIKVALIAVGLLGPSQKIHLKAVLDRPVTDEIMTQIRDQTRAIYVYGNARYRDAFHKYWRLEYRYICGGVADTDFLYSEKIAEHESSERDHRSLLELSGLSVPLDTGVGLSTYSPSASLRSSPVNGGG
jgi:hypothetical protein